MLSRQPFPSTRQIFPPPGNICPAKGAGGTNRIGGFCRHPAEKDGYWIAK
jgi:hypothetical protein